ncbi:helicase carboxy-terminal domain protein (macronuclear) [Tetrahymena thermophila SB210]|uniref:Helicase carboxy-terminal domain protein n=1 Tax=Tetrahymena thermophila (strain SB210) TaxID=312017 RepID=I7MKP0_TETTS|nr:helicase carboxy-terminal domain protein [Tetrahymena thermophila SB210]EAR99650.2 helicase carboxy-terminal domain protein [Tetrahymena thermophila SB210]|eukprot:XP_001019895.2 helicase carboxy-terminal domain protein [Tetrahymena thermophila SB210]
MGKIPKSKESSAQKNKIKSQKYDPKVQQIQQKLHQKEDHNEDQQIIVNEQEHISDNNVKQQTSAYCFQNIMIGVDFQIYQNQFLKIPNSFQEIPNNVKDIQNNQQEPANNEFDDQVQKIKIRKRICKKRNKITKNQEDILDLESNKCQIENEQQYLNEDFEKFLFKDVVKIKKKQNELLSTNKQNVQNNQLDQNSCLNEYLNQILESQVSNQKKTRKYTRRQNKKAKQGKEEGEVDNNIFNYLQSDETLGKKGDENKIDVEQNQVMKENENESQNQEDQVKNQKKTRKYTRRQNKIVKSEKEQVENDNNIFNYLQSDKTLDETLGKKGDENKIDVEQNQVMKENENESQNQEDQVKNQKKTRKYTRRQNKIVKSEKEHVENDNYINNNLQSEAILEKKQDEIETGVEQHQVKKKRISRKKKQNISEDNQQKNQENKIFKDFISTCLNVKQNQSFSKTLLDYETDQKQDQVDLNSNSPKNQNKYKKKKKIEYEENDNGENSIKDNQGQQKLQVNEQEKDLVFELCKDIFPHENPYPNQLDSMQEIIKTLKNKKNLLFQSPTGTGKTLMTISSALAYVEQNPNTKILLLTRTCEQINGFIKEIRKIKKFQGINRYSILAGRNQFCPKFNQIQKYFKEKNIDIKLSNEDINKLCSLITEGQQEEEYDDEEEEDEDKNQEEEDQDKEEKLVEKNQENKDFQHQRQIIKLLGILDENLNEQDVKNYIKSIQLFKQQQKVQETKTQDQISTEVEKDKNLLYKNESGVLEKCQNNLQFIQKNEEVKLYETIQNQQNKDQISPEVNKDENESGKLELCQNNFQLLQQNEEVKRDEIIQNQENHNQISIQVEKDEIEGGKLEKCQNNFQLLQQNEEVKLDEIIQNQENHNQISIEVEKDEIEGGKLEKCKNNFYLLQNNEEVELNEIIYNLENEQLDYCEYYKDFKKNISTKQNIKWRYPKVKRNFQQEFMLPDIEDINHLFQEKELGCPYFYSKEAAKSAKIVYSTYNYVIKQHILSRVKHLFENSDLIVIFDEGHNIAELAEQEQKLTINKDHWDTFYETVKKFNSYFQKSKLNNETSNTLKQLIAKEIENEAQYFKILIQRQSKKQEKQKSQENKDEKNPINLIKEILLKKSENKESGKQYIKQKNFTFIDLYDQIKQCIQKQHLIIARQDVKDLVDFIEKDDPEDLKLDEQIVSQKLEIYKKARKEELFSFLNNFQNSFLDITEFCENNFISWFNPQNNKNKNFSELFYCQSIYSHLQKLEFVDILQMKEFVKKSQEIYKMLNFIKALIEKNLKKKFAQVCNPINNLVDIAKDIHINSFFTINKFFQKLLFLRNEQQINDKSQILLDYYLCFSRDNDSLYFQIGCLSAKEIFRKIKDKIRVNSFIFSSGTLEPYDLITDSICLPFEIYESKNIFNSQENLFTQVITKYQEKEIHLNFENKEDLIVNAINAIQDILNIFLNYTRKLNKKQGFLIFFKSYSYLNQYYKQIRSIAKKQFYVYKETSDSKDFKAQFEQYKNNIESNYKNCIFLGVCKGKLSEGIDFKDNLCRIAIILGVPYPQLFDPYVNCQRKRYQLKFMKNDWYEKVTSKVVNQAAGRCIRHKNDWGCIFFLDSNFSHYKIKKNISGWILDGEKHKKDEQDVIQDDWQNQYKAFLVNIVNQLALKNYSN